MGISPAPFIANLFLAWYEFKFLRQYGAASALGRAVLAAFHWTKQYLDDLLELRSRFLAGLLLCREDAPGPHGLRGIYPPALDIPEQSHPHLPEGQVSFLDMLLLLVHQPVAGRSLYTIRLYDKQAQPAFQGVRLSRFVHTTCSVNEAAKRNVFVCQGR